jgi:acyl-[acyl-carrier-protein]-phospholipid O-acyltransferase / long-chain-fatty-acid--[acyl-carrier-protein] ligase
VNHSSEPTESSGSTPPASHLPSHRGFWNLIATQFQGAFSDNALKNLVIFLILGMNLPHERANRMISLVGIIFAIPFLLFSLAGGYFADRFSKRSVTICTKYLEIAVMILAFAGLAAKNLPLQFAAIFLVCTQAALFGGAKYGLLPELLRESELSWGNGILELGTFVAALTGTMAGAFLADTFRGQQGWSGALLLAISLIGLATSYGISRVPVAAPQRKYTWNPFADLRDQLKIISSDRLLTLAVLGNIYFWYLAALIVLVVVVYGTSALGLTALRTSYLQAAMAVGIGAGSVAAGYFSNRQIEYGFIPLGAGGMAAACAALAMPHLGYWTVFAELGALGFFAGFFAVPINALIQHQPPIERRGSVIATANLLSWVGIGLASAVYYVTAEVFHLAAQKTFLVSAGTTLITLACIVIAQPDSISRLLKRLGWRSV